MPLDRAVLEADLALIRGLLRQVITRESSAGIVEAVSTLSRLLADRAGADVPEVQARLLELLAAEGLLPGRVAASTPPSRSDRDPPFSALSMRMPIGD
ncbi:hypothetical protein [Cognatilysobacter tabacisoli]|uniref:hypothetical protein n=1 Tax=Cognatilysobacter tabacisoli TaxID=2315424 RepID=UPI000E6B0B11|nr:hypothetical protein [Lysobacter tabacisoli]